MKPNSLRAASSHSYNWIGAAPLYGYCIRLICPDIGLDMKEKEEESERFLQRRPILRA